MNGRAWLLLAAALALAGAVHWASQRPVAHAPGELVNAVPEQVAPADATPIRVKDFTLRPLADFTVEARVLSRHDYHFGTESELSPTDLALGWRGMSDSAVLAKLDISQSGRFFHYRWRDAPPLPPRDIIRSSANMHMIPADAGVARQIKAVRVGDIVTLRGQLVAVTRPDGWHWTSSLTRDDTGAGACELIYVRDVTATP